MRGAPVAETREIVPFPCIASIGAISGETFCGTGEKRSLADDRAVAPGKNAGAVTSTMGASAVSDRYSAHLMALLSSSDAPRNQAPPRTRLLYSCRRVTIA